MQEKTILQYIKGELSSSERASVLEWIRKDVRHQKIFNVTKAKYIASTINCFDKNDTKVAYESFYKRKNSKKKKKYYPIAAAAILLPLFTWYTFTGSLKNNFWTGTHYQSSAIKTVTTQLGAHKTITLPDGSTVILNSNSDISYAKSFSDSLRIVQLSGEAFFDVKRDTTRPFIVRTDQLKIKVLGTSFNVKSYPVDKSVETTLVTGKVEVLRKANEIPIVLAPSQKAIFDKEKKDIRINEVNSENVVAWKKGKLTFDQTPLKQVVLDLQRKYNVEFVIESDALLKYKYTGEFDNLNLTEVLDFLKLSSSINYKIVKNKIMLNSE
ncbi:FecR domain-containing protein [Aquimarina sp. U1-2]|uniref:FecR family protein n=1 Tax=Aquimarina sp. U1-2 TaxID=2823141 RepID=UPI001AECCC00|nr:FecR domain-containing protein [Aquimarina sp. U1-2]MBP2833549.1 FecR domain-containing protein [Aquimarina sp. U1-2]